MKNYIAALLEEDEMYQEFQSDRCIETPSKLVRDNFLYVQETGYIECTKPYASQRGEMNSFLIIYVLSGSGYITCQGQTTAVSTGACFFHNGAIPYSHECKEKNSWDLIWVHFNGNTASTYYNQFIHHSKSILYPVDGMKIAELLKLILQNTQKKPRFFELRNNAYLTSLLTELITTPKIERKTNHHRVSIDEKLEEIHLYLEKNYMHDCSLDKLSEQFYISKYYLSREFTAKYGENISSYITNLRITRAKELLRFSPKKMNEIATLCGINDSNHFLKTFKKREGITPTEYRNEWRESHFSNL